MSMYAVFETGGKQYRAQAGDIVQIEKLEGDVGATLKFDRVLFLSKQGADDSQVWMGKPLVSGAAVQAEIVGQGRGEKILIVKMKRRKQYRRTQGHRQFYTQVIVTGVDNGSGEKTTLEAAAKTERLAKFQSHLKAKGLAMTPKTLGSRKRLAAARASGKTEAKAAAPAKAKKAPAAKKASKKAEA